MDLDDFLKKAMEEEMREDDSDGKSNADISKEVADSVLGILSMGKILTLSRAAIEYKKKLLKDLMECFNNADPKDEARWIASLSSKVLITSKKISVLDVIISTGVFSNMMSKDNDYDILNRIIGTSTLL